MEQADHGVGRSPGQLSSKIHCLVDGTDRPLVVLVGPSQAGDAPMFPHLMDHLRVTRRGPRRARTRPDRLRADKSYSSRAIRTRLRARGITAVILEPADQAGHRKRRGSRGGRPQSFDAEDYKGRNVVERSFNVFKHSRGLALITVVAGCYLAGVSTRRMDKLVKTLGINSLSKSQVSCMTGDLDEHVQSIRHRPLDDAGSFTFVAAEVLTMKFREGGRVGNAVMLLATGTNGDGHREFLACGWPRPRSGRRGISSSPTWWPAGWPDSA